MKLYKCKISETVVREGFIFMVSPSVELAHDPLWVRHADTEGDIDDDLEKVKTTFQVLDVQEVNGLNEVPDNWRDVLPWYHPQHRPSEDVEIEKLLVTAVEDDGKWAADMMKILERRKEQIEWEMEGLREFILPNASSDGAAGCGPNSP